MKKFISLMLVMLMAFSSVSAFAANVSVVVDGEVVTDKAYHKGWSTYAPLGELDGSDSADETAVRDYFEDKGAFVGWDQENQTVKVSTTPFGNY